MADLVDRLTALEPQIERLIETGGAAGLLLGVLHHGEPIYQANFGLRDLQKALAPTQETIFPGCSLVKPLTAASIALLVEEKRITWDKLVENVLPNSTSRISCVTVLQSLTSSATAPAWSGAIICMSARITTFSYQVRTA